MTLFGIINQLTLLFLRMVARLYFIGDLPWLDVEMTNMSMILVLVFTVLIESKLMSYPVACMSAHTCVDHVLIDGSTIAMTCPLYQS